MSYQTETEISNMALAHLGEYVITSMDDGSKPARICNQFFDLTRDSLLREHRWNFAQSRKTLSQLAAAPNSIYDYQYQLPSDSLRLLELNDTEIEQGYGDRWEVEGEMLVTDEEEAKILYVKKVTDPSLFDPLFVRALALALAVEIAPGIKGSGQSLVQGLVERLEAVVKPMAKKVDSNESRPRTRIIPWRSINTDLRRRGFYRNPRYRWY